LHAKLTNLHIDLKLIIYLYIVSLEVNLKNNNYKVIKNITEVGKHGKINIIYFS